MAQQQFRYNSFSGSDIVATFAGVRIGEIQGISISSSREKAPIYTLGRTNPLGFSRGKRGIAGSLVFILFDKHALLSTMAELGNFKFAADNYEIRSVDYNGGAVIIGPPKTNAESDQAFGTETRFDNTLRPSETGLWSASDPFYADQIPPFDIVIFGANEHGNTGKMIIHGVEILNEGMGISIDDIVTEQQMTFVATEITPFVRTETVDLT